VERAGNLSNLRTPEAKKFIIRNYLKSDQYNEAYLFDDSLENIKSFASLQRFFPSVLFFSSLVINQ
jgi:hypothetical protein